jgi:hypothetical protein
MERALRLFALALLASLGFLAASCASEEPRPKGPEDDVSGLPWNRPMPGEKGGAMGGMPFQSH